MVSNAVFLFITSGWKDFSFRNGKFLDFVHPYSLLEYFQNKEIDSNKAILKRQHKNGSIKKQFLNRGNNKLYWSHIVKKEGASMWNTWVICVFVLFYHGNWREAGLRFLHNLSLSCFVNGNDFYQDNDFPILYFHKELHHRWCGGQRSDSGLSVSCAKHYQKD